LEDVASIQFRGHLVFQKMKGVKITVDSFKVKIS
jgi:hypothetical protein